MAVLHRVPGGADADGDRDRLGLFAALLAAALVLHVLWWHGLAVRSPWFAVVLAAGWVLARPTAFGRLLLLLAVASAAIVLELPALGTHLLLVLVLSCCVLVDVAVRRVRDGAAPGPAVAFARLRPFLRALVVVLYLAAALAKLNTTYLDPAVSPAGPLSAQVLWFAPDALAAPWHVRPAIWGSLAAELALPVLLLWRRTRSAALVVGLLFHAALALAGTVPFTALVLALYVAFLPGDVVGRVRDAAARVRRVGVPAGALPAAAVCAWLAAAALDVAPGRTTGEVLATATRVLVAGAGVAAAVLVVSTGRRTRAGRGPSAAAGARSSGRPGRPAPAFVAGLVALVLVAASPYLGHRAGDAFTMYSGLDASPDGWNHVLPLHEAPPRGEGTRGRTSTGGRPAVEPVRGPEGRRRAARRRHPGPHTIPTSTLRPPGPPTSSKLVAVRLHTRRADGTTWVDRGGAYVPESVVRPGATGLFYDGLSHQVEDVRGEGADVEVWARAATGGRRR
ncbi:unannotated protein [freshwater metagenome]|uniref:Unannotated protein n=1 Tax=freshwater metagenome TaxID=449393 RepID=A0A6J7K1P7_9ZZZZ|nr:hypothetical protein [Actinomycetota bacterium]